MAEPEAENGCLLLFPPDEPAMKLVEQRWPFARVSPFGNGLRIDLSGAPKGSNPGFEDTVGLVGLSRSGPKRVVIGFFCDSKNKTEGVRVIDAGREAQRGKVEWAKANPPDPIAWPVAGVAMSLGVPIEAITRVKRPPRPPLAVACEALLNGGKVDEDKLRHQAIDLLGNMANEPATKAIAGQLKHTDWVTRFHAVRAYARVQRQQGQGDKPALDALLADEDEGVREAALKGIAELLPSVTFSDAPLHRQIDQAIKLGLADADEDVREVAAKVQELRKQLLG